MKFGRVSSNSIFFVNVVLHNFWIPIMNILSHINSSIKTQPGLTSTHGGTSVGRIPSLAGLDLHLVE